MKYYNLDEISFKTCHTSGQALVRTYISEKLDLQSVLDNDVPNCTSSLSSKIQGVVDKHAPLQTRKVSDRVSAPWFNTDIKRAKQHQRKAEQRWRKSGFSTDRRLFVVASRDVTHLIQALLVNF